MENNFIIISVILPICLHLDDRVFKIAYNKESFVEIRAFNFFTNNYSRIGSGQNMEVESDTFSQFRFTKIQVKIPVFEKIIIGEREIPNKYNNVFFKYYNKFIDAYRIATGREKIRNSWSFNDFLKPMDISTSAEEMKIISYNFGDEPLVTVKPFRSQEEHNAIEKYLDEVPDLFIQFFSDARRDFLYSYYIQSNLNAVIALEIAVSDYIRNFASSKGIDRSSIDNFIKDVGLTGNIKTTLKMITPSEIALPNDEIFNRCKSAITSRNKIVHEGLRDISVTELEKNLIAIEEMIRFCKTLT